MLPKPGWIPPPPPLPNPELGQWRQHREFKQQQKADRKRKKMLKLMEGKGTGRSADACTERTGSSRSRMYVDHFAYLDRLFRNAKTLEEHKHAMNELNRLGEANRRDPDPPGF
jgi:hypothetical protein